MKRIVKVIILVAAVLMLMSPAAIALTINAGEYVKLLSYNSLDMAGIMTYSVSLTQNGPSIGTYDTFCIQDNVYIWQNESFKVKSVTTNVGPFAPAHAGEGTLNGAVDYLFYRYKSGAYNSILTNTSDASNVAENDFQRLLWSLQHSGPSYSSSGYAWSNDLITYNTTASMQQHSWGTQVLNIVDSSGLNDIQNQLYNPIVPEPSTFVLLGVGLVGAVAFRKRLLKKQTESIRLQI